MSQSKETVRVGSPQTATQSAYEAQQTATAVVGWDNNRYQSSFLSSFAANPIVIGTINTHNAGNGGWLRQCDLSTSQVGYQIDEDQYNDTERLRAAEIVGFAAFSESFDAQFTDAVGTWKMEAGSISLPAIASAGATPISHAFRQSYSSPPLVIVSMGGENADPTDVCVYSVSTTRFTLRTEEPANADGDIDASTVTHLAIDPGTHELPDGTRILAATVTTQSQQHGPGVKYRYSGHFRMISAPGTRFRSIGVEHQVGNGHHLHARGRGLVVPLRGHRFVLEIGRRLVHECRPGSSAGPAFLLGLQHPVVGQLAVGPGHQ